VLVMLLVWVSFSGALRARRASVRTFSEGAVRRGLSVREQEILRAVASSGGLERTDGIFAMEDAFELGAAKLIESSQSQHGSEVSKRLVDELVSLKEKLGFKGASGRSHGEPRFSSRQVQVGKKLHLTRRSNPSRGDGSDTIEGTVVGNDAMELSVKLDVQVRVTFGETWRVRYYFGASVWEFDTTVNSYDGGVLVLNHSDDIRFINRRRFVRVPVRDLAFISRFPFSKLLPLAGGKGIGVSVEDRLIERMWESWKPLEFVHAVVTELAGPGLRIEAPLDVKVGERVLVVFKLDPSEDYVGAKKQGAVSRIIEDIGEVRRSEKTENGFSMGIELVGLTDSDISELIRVTNAVAAKANLTKGVEHTPAGKREAAEVDSQSRPVGISVEGA